MCSLVYVAVAYLHNIQGFQNITIPILNQVNLIIDYVTKIVFFLLKNSISCKFKLRKAIYSRIGVVGSNVGAGVDDISVA